MNRRVFWENGFRTVGAIANADPSELVPVLMQAQPNKIRLKGKEDGAKYEEKLIAKADIISASANKLWRKLILALCPLGVRFQLTYLQAYNYKRR